MKSDRQNDILQPRNFRERSSTGFTKFINNGNRNVRPRFLIPLEKKLKSVILFLNNVGKKSFWILTREPYKYMPFSANLK